MRALHLTYRFCDQTDYLIVGSHYVAVEQGGMSVDYTLMVVVLGTHDNRRVFIALQEAEARVLFNERGLRIAAGYPADVLGEEGHVADGTLAAFAVVVPLSERAVSTEHVAARNGNGARRRFPAEDTFVRLLIVRLIVHRVLAVFGQLEHNPGNALPRHRLSYRPVLLLKRIHQKCTLAPRLAHTRLFWHLRLHCS